MTDGRLDLSVRPWAAAFASPEVELRFREQVLPDYRRRAVPVVLLVGFFTLTLLIRDLLTLQADETLMAAVLGRSPTVLVCFGVAFVAARTGSVRVFEFALLGFSSAIVGATIFLHTSGGGSPFHHAVDMFGLIVVVLAIPNRFWFQAVPGFLLMGDGILHSIVREGVTAQTGLSLWMAYLLGTVISVYVARLLHIQARELFRAQAQIRTMTGIVPICLTCKAVRDGEGEWHRVERYVTAHTEAQFSHGYCPECATVAQSEVDRW